MKAARSVFLVMLVILVIGILAQGTAQAEQNDDPYIEEIEPTSGVPGTKVTITGENFNKIAVIQRVQFGSERVPGARTIEWTDNKIIVEAPRGKGTVEVRAQGPAGKTNPVQFTYLEPIIESVSPSLGQPGEEVMIKGRNFGKERSGLTDYSVNFGASNAKIKSWSDTEIVTMAPEDYGMGIDDAALMKRLVTLGKAGILDKDELITVLKETAPHLIPDVATIEFREGDPWWKSVGKIMFALALPIEIVPEELGRDGHAMVAIEVRTPPGEALGLFKYSLAPIVTPPGSNVAIVIDVSGSMRGEKLRRAKAAASSFIHSSDEKSWVSLISFSSGAETIVELSRIKENRSKLKKKIDSLSVGGNTNIGAGLEAGLEALFSGSSPPKNPVIILLSDGEHNTGELWPAVEKCVEKEVRVKTIAFGSGADEKTLREIANRTNGQALIADLTNISHVYHQINNEVQNRSTFFRSSDLLKQGEQLTYPFFVDSGVDNLSIFTTWKGSSVLMELTNPSGEKIIPHESNEYTHTQEKTYSLLELEAEPGKWEAKLKERNFPSEGQKVNFSVSGESPLYTNLRPLQVEYDPGEGIVIALEVAEIKNLERVPLKDVEINAQITKPHPTVIEKSGKDIEISLGGLFEAVTEERDIELPLYDRENKGLFTNTFSETDTEGVYFITIAIETEVSSQRISRQITETFRVGSIEDSKLTGSELLEEVFEEVLYRILDD